MKKEGGKEFINSRNGKVNLAMFFLIILIFVLTLISVEAISIRQLAPGNLTINGTANRNITFYFNVTWGATAGSGGENQSNCSLYINSTTNAIAWANVRNVTNGTSPGNGTSIGNMSVSFINFTFSADGNFSWGIACLNATPGAVDSDAVIVSNFSTNHTNFTVFVDTTAPEIAGAFPSAIFGPGLWANYTSLPINFNVTVKDNTTNAVWYILNSRPGGAGPNETIGGRINNVTFSPFNSATGTATSLTLSANGSGSGGANTTYFVNVSLTNFTGDGTDIWRGPGAHSVFFCANDSVGTTTCSGPYDFAVIGMNITVIENMMNNFGFTPPGFTDRITASLNITYGNLTEIPLGTFINPQTQNITIIVNTSGNRFTFVVGMRMDEKQMGNISSTNYSISVDPAIQRAVGIGFNVSMMWSDIGSMMPTFASYAFGIIELAGVGYDKHMYCNGTTAGSPNCMAIDMCNATVFSVLNTSTINEVIPTTEPRACWLESDRGSLDGVGLNNLSTITVGGPSTFIFVRKFSGGVGGNDTGAPDVQIFGTLVNNETARSRLDTPLFDVSIYNTTSTFVVINFTIADINSTGINMSINRTINVTIADAGNQLGARIYESGIGRNLTCLPVGFATNSSVFNITGQDNMGNLTDGVNCTVTVTGLSNGTKNITIQARDASNSSNLNITSVLMIVDQIPPVQSYFNLTNSSTNSSGGAGDNVVKTFGDSATGSITQGSRFFAVSNWTDNLTTVLAAELQYYNTSSNRWETANVTGTTTNATPRATGAQAWANFSFALPPAAHDIFEGQNISFRVVANDSLGNKNTTVGVLNFTILINDTKAPNLVVSSVGGSNVVNLTNTTNTKPNVVINVTERSGLDYVAIQIDSLTETNCGKLNFTTTANSNRNGTFDLFSAGGCAGLSNGTHTVRLTSQDTWGNTELYIHSFDVASGVIPGITLVGLDNGGISTTNNSNITPFTGMNVSAVMNGAGIIKNISFTSSCNSTPQTFTNNTVIYPFNYSGCKGAEANRTVTITTFDTAGNSNTTVFGFLVDDVGPSLSVNAPANGFSGSNNVTFNLSAKDGSQSISAFGYFLDEGIALGRFVALNLSSAIGAVAGNTTNTFILNITSGNLTPGTHTIKFSVRDALGTVANNTVNSSVITITANGPIIFSNVNTSIEDYSATVFGTNLSNVSIRIKTDAGTYADISAANETNYTYEILYTFNSNITNISLTEINGSAVNWDKINFTPYINQTSFVAGLEGNWTVKLLPNSSSVWFNNSLEEFITNNNSYYGVVVFKINNTVHPGIEFWWIENEDVLTNRTNITQCTGGFSRTSTTPCWNYTSGGRTIVQVPHFSIIAAVNDSSAPTINVTTPVGNQSVGAFRFNITVSQDAQSCVYAINGTVAGQTMTKSGTICIGQTESFKNLEAANGGYNVTFNVTDGAGNVNTYIFKFNVSDVTAPNTPNSTRVSTSVSTTTATVTISDINETVNATVFYGTAIGSLSSIGMETDFTESQSVALSSLSASTLYYFNVSICDFNGNCAKNGTFNFTTSAAAAEAAAAAAAAGGGGGGGAVPVSNIEASAGRQWDTLAAGSSGTLTINNEKIGITSVIIDIKNKVTSPSITVEKLVNNPYTVTAAAKVYQYLQITRSNIADTDTSKITMKFRVSKSWLTTNGVGESNIALWRYTSGAWKQVETKLVSSDASYVNYEAITPGLSTFAIGSKEGGTSAFAIIDMIRDFYAGTSKLTAFDIIDQIRSFYGG